MKNKSLQWTDIKPFRTPIIIGIIIRLFLLFVSYKNLGYYGGDAWRYLDIANLLLKGSFDPGSVYPPGFPAVLAPAIGIFHSLLPVSLLNIFLYSLFSVWFSKKISEVGGLGWGLASAWFLTLDPVWFAQTIIIGSDFQGALIFDLPLIVLLDKNSPPSSLRSFLLGLGFGLAALFKPVYVYVPILAVGLFFKKQFPPMRRVLAAVLFLAGSLLVVGLHVGARYSGTHRVSISGHGSLLYGRYIVGNILIARGQTEDLTRAMDMGEELYLQKKAEGSSQTFESYVKETVLQNPGIFARLFFISAGRTVFGNSNGPIVRFFTGTNVEGPGLGVGISRQAGLLARLKAVNWFWLFGVFFMFLEKLVLLFLALKGTSQLVQNKMHLEASVLWLLVFYFALTPIVFGEPRYFLPGTLILLYLASASPLEAFFTRKSQV